jgi:signal peptidase I
MSSVTTPGPIVRPDARSWWRRLRTAAWWVTGVPAVLLAVAVWPQQYAGVTTVTVVSGQSMEPTYHSGDLLLTRRHAYGPGDVVVYEVPADQPGAGHRGVHRLVGGDGTTGWRTQGDNNDAPDVWTPRDPDIIGGVVLHVPKLGLLIMQLRSPLTWAAVGAVVIGRMLWPSAEEHDGAPGAPAPPDAVRGEVG